MQPPVHHYPSSAHAHASLRAITARWLSTGAWSIALVAMVIALGACTDASTDSTGPTDAGSTGDTDAISVGADTSTIEPPQFPPAPAQLGGDRPSDYILPKNYSHETSWPVIVLLHGYQVDGRLQDMFFGLSGLVDELGFLLLRPDGTTDSKGHPFWNATFACCDRDQTNVDDVSYIHSLLDEMETYFNVDRRRIYLMGHSNGGFMSYRLACDSAERFAGLMSLAGATYFNESACLSDTPLAVLQVHGTQDSSIDYDGGKIKGIMPYPSAMETVSRWVQKNGCGDAITPPNIDIDVDINGPETSVQRWKDCTSGFDVALWTIEEGKHIPGVYDGTFARAAIDFLFSHQRTDISER